MGETRTSATPTESASVRWLADMGLTRDTLGQFVREAWVRWAQTQPNPKASWLVPWDDLGESDREADRCIGTAVALMAIAHFSAAAPASENVR